MDFRFYPVFLLLFLLSALPATTVAQDHRDDHQVEPNKHQSVSDNCHMLRQAPRTIKPREGSQEICPGSYVFRTRNKALFYPPEALVSNTDTPLIFCMYVSQHKTRCSDLSSLEGETITLNAFGSRLEVEIDDKDEGCLEVEVHFERQRR